MEYRRLGKSGLQLSVLSLGSWVTFHKQLDDALSDQLMGIAYDQGINFFDNAESYAGGESEKQMGRVLKNKKWDRSSLVISSKSYFGWRGKDKKPNQWGLSRKHLVESCHEALNRLQVDYLDLFFCHRPDRQTPIEEVVQTMNILIRQGKVLYWGTSEWSAAAIMEAHLHSVNNGLIGPTMEQPEYNLFNRYRIEREYLQLFTEYGMGATIWSPLASGMLTGKYNNGIPSESRLALEGFEWLKDKAYAADKVEKVRQLKQVADQLGTSLATLSIAWCISNPLVTTAILGATKSTQLEENLKALDIYPRLDSGIKDTIDGIMDSRPIQPEWGF
ncbi:MAG TPA: aldo/keto reductase [Chitinophagaceae bacterium]|nr:aldo/keto reductase [Chitinophagaceae bacterium]